jgi:hypothetical protein
LAETSLKSTGMTMLSVINAQDNLTTDFLKRVFTQVWNGYPIKKEGK